MIALRAHDIRHSVPAGPGRRVLLDGVGLELRAGRSAAVIGTSGAGKSTLLAILGLLARPEAGRVFLGEDEVSFHSQRRTAALRNRKLGFVFQNYSLLPQLTVRENVQLPLMHGAGLTTRARRVAVDSALEALGLRDRAESRPRELSGGEQQRVAIARAVIRRPTVLLADEPTGSLDGTTAGQALDVLTGAARETDAALLVVTHDVGVAARMEAVLRLDEGRLEPDTACAS